MKRALFVLLAFFVVGSVLGQSPTTICITLLADYPLIQFKRGPAHILELNVVLPKFHRFREPLTSDAPRPHLGFFERITGRLVIGGIV